MIKRNLKTMIVTSIVTLIPILVGIILWDQLPDQMATHFGANGQPDDWSSKEFVVFGLPLLLVALQWIIAGITSTDPKKQNISDKMFSLMLWLVPAVSIVGCGSTYAYELYDSINILTIGTALLGMVLLITGNFMPKMKQSYTLGMRFSWTLNSEENWRRTHRLGGYVWMISGILTVCLGLLNMTQFVLPIIFFTAIIPAIYSFVLYKKGV